MAFASSVHPSMAVQCLSSSLRHRLLVGNPAPVRMILPPRPPSRSVLALARRRRPNSSTTGFSSAKKKEKSSPRNEDVDEDDLDDDPFEALFSQLEEDLKNGLSLDDEDDEKGEEEFARFEKELGEVLGDGVIEIARFEKDLGEALEDGVTELAKLGKDFGEVLGDGVKEMFNLFADNIESNNDGEEEGEEEKEEEEEVKEDVDDKEEEEEEDERPVKLRNWQVRRLAAALKAGRRKTSIKTLAAELCLDRAVVLELLRDPPPNLLMMSLALADEPASTESVSVSETKPMESNHTKESVVTEEPRKKVQEPVHVMQHRWSAQKRLKKAQVETLERVYRRTKRPTNAMISSIVHVTNIPRKRVVKWFEDKRTVEGVPDQRVPYQRSVPETV